MRVPLLLTAALFCVALPDPASSRRTTWSGGQAGVSLNETELEIYSVSDEVSTSNPSNSPPRGTPSSI